MAGRAFLRRLVVLLLHVAGHAEGADRHQRGNPGGCVTGITLHVGRARMRGGEISPGVALDAIPLLLMVWHMTALAGSYAVGRRGAGRPVAIGANDLGVRIVAKADRAGYRRAHSYLHPQLRLPRGGKPFGAMAAGAIPGLDPARDHRLMMTQVAASRHLEDESGSRPVHQVAGQAGK